MTRQRKIVERGPSPIFLLSNIVEAVQSSRLEKPESDERIQFREIADYEHRR